jgi:ATP-binding cassette, subfamily A (ABC1), member 3
MVSGVSLSAYWTSNLFMDYCKHLVTSIFCMLMSLAFEVEAFTREADSFGALALLFILFGWSAINFSYLAGFMFKSYGNAQVASFFLHFIMVIIFFSIIKLIFFMIN